MSDHFIYVIAVAKPGQPPGPVKIGITNNVPARLKGLQTACPYPLYVVHQFAAPDRICAREIERAFHEVQKKHQTTGEWFDLEPSLALFLMCICIETMLHYCTSLRGIEMQTALDMAGVDAAYAKLKETRKSGGALQ
jgi:Meiotically up-regulated gene 113